MGEGQKVVRERGRDRGLVGREREKAPPRAHPLPQWQVLIIEHNGSIVDAVTSPHLNKITSVTVATKRLADGSEGASPVLPHMDLCEHLGWLTCSCVGEREVYHEEVGRRYHK